MANMIIIKDYKTFIKTIKYMCNWYLFFSNGQQVVDQLDNTISPQVVDDLKTTVLLLYITGNLSDNLKSSLPTIEEIEAELGEIDG